MLSVQRTAPDVLPDPRVLIFSGVVHPGGLTISVGPGVMGACGDFLFNVAGGVGHLEGEGKRYYRFFELWFEGDQAKGGGDDAKGRGPKIFPAE